MIIPFRGPLLVLRLIEEFLPRQKGQAQEEECRPESVLFFLFIFIDKKLHLSNIRHTNQAQFAGRPEDLIHSKIDIFIFLINVWKCQKLKKKLFSSIIIIFFYYHTYNKQRLNKFLTPYKTFAKNLWRVYQVFKKLTYPPSRNKCLFICFIFSNFFFFYFTASTSRLMSGSGCGHSRTVWKPFYAVGVNY